MVVFLGIDGGGTGCRAAVADSAGTILGLGAAGPANVNTDVTGTFANIMTATRQALSGHTIAETDLVAVLGLAGANISAAVDHLHQMLPFARTRIVTDAVTAARGALGGADGIVAAMGTGSVFAVQRAGVMRQFGGRGFVLGDQGSGAVLGRTLLAEALRADDGFAPMTPLLAEVLGEFGGIEGIITFGFRARPAEFAALAPRIVQSDDPAARRIFEDAVKEVRGIVETLQAGDRLPLVFLGGLGPSYSRHLGELWEIRAPLGSGLDGAVRLALEEA
ncbi:glucosamine kinase [Gemmobacter caeni]|uniref:Glucosamine kinase n=1 Tax=Gemmobacter caeni TaxID=589035 RepID=A0A2T6AQW2_9RHOB|nr:BadF/BadG/BcrA/BcrD ATPase family protein [Gemmobacter caeni]PTX46146.1 glucosamine kinase [Gemmobacter caeni]TWI94489.1 glucosamine kinase [Gemmobacter caeni]